MSERILSVGGNKASRPIGDFLLEKSKIWYVGPSEKDDGDDGRSGRSKETSLATLDAAIDLAVASTTSYNDIIYVLPNHGETVSTAGMIALDKIGLRVIGLGTGAYRPTFTFSALDSTITMTAASCSIENVILIPSIDSVVSGIVVSAANCKVDVEVQDANDIEFVTAILTTAAADNLDINLKYLGDIGGNACVAPIQLVGADTARIYVDFYGVASTAVVNFITTACLNIDIAGLFNNVGTALTKNVVDTEGNGSWSVRGWDGVANANFTGGDAKTVAYADLETIASDLVLVDTVVDKIYSDTGNIRTDATEILSDLETVKSDLVAADLVIDKIYSDTGNIRTDATEILSDLETIGSDLITFNTELLSDLETIKSDLVVADAVADKIYSDTGNIRTDATEILSDLETIGSDLIAADLVIDKIYSDTGNIRTDATEMLSDLETTKSDLVVLDTAFDTFYTKYLSDITAIVSDIATKT